MLLDLPMTHEATLRRMRERGIEFEHFFDVGAARGLFGVKVREVYPEVGLIYFEAAPYWKPLLEKTKSELGGKISIEMAAAGPSDGEMYFRFDENNPMGGALVSKKSDNTQIVPVRSLDSYIEEKGLTGRFALKLDVHGVEQMILSGAERLMSSCQLLIFETYNFGPDHRRFGQMAVHVEEKFGMRCIDIAEPKYRPFDKALWQMDFYFGRYEGTTLSEWRL